MQHRLGIRQWFPWPSSIRARSDAAIERAEAAQQIFEAHALALGGEVARVYWRLWLIEEEQKILREQIAVLKTTEKLAETLVETGSANVSMLAQIALRIARHESHRDRLKEDRARASSTLAFTLGLQDTAAFKLGGAPPTTRLPSENFGVLAEDLSQHPRVRTVLSESSAEEATARAARGDRAPRFALGLDWTVIGDSAVPIPDGGKDALSINASISVPIWANGAAGKARVARAKSRAHRAHAEHIRGLLRSELRVLLTDLSGSARTIATYETKMIPQALTARQSVYFGFEAGRVGVAELLDMHAICLELELELVRRRYEHEVAWSDLEALMGRPVGGRSVDDG
jgi:outer membrane protein TolC